MKKILLIILPIIVVISVIAIASIFINNNKENPVDQQISKNNDIREKEKIIPINKNLDEEQIYMNLESSGSYLIDMSNNTTIANEAECIIIGTVESIDGMTNYNPTTGNYVMARTVGTINVSKVIKGNLNEDTISFIRLGGVVPLGEYLKSQPQAHLEKMGLNNLSQEDKENKYVKERMAGDIEIEENKTYLMYIAYSDYYDRYSIEYLQYGLREVEESLTSTNQNLLNANSKILSNEAYTTIRVKNNTNGEYETLDSIIPKSVIKNTN